MKKILLIENNKEILESTSRALKLAHNKVFTAKNAEEGFELAQKENPDLIICDSAMPAQGGHCVLDLLSGNPATAGIPFISMNSRIKQTMDANYRNE